MTQDGHHAGHLQGADGNGTPPPAITREPGSGESSNQASTWTPVPAVAAEVDGSNGKGDDVVPSVHGAGLAAGNVDAGTDVMVAEEDVSTKSKGKAPASDGAGKKARTSTFMLERARRKLMKENFAELRALLPGVSKKTNRETTVEETIRYIGVLEDTVKTFEKRKQELALERERRQAAAQPDLGAGPSSAAAPPDAGQVPILSPVLPQGWCWLPKQQPAAPGAVAEQPRVGFRTWTDSNVVMNVCGDTAFITVCAAPRPGVLVLLLSVLAKHHIDVLTLEISSDANRSLFHMCTRVNLEEIKQLDPEAPASDDIFQLALSEIIVWLSG